MAEYANQIGDEPIILTNDGKPVAALISLEDVDLETITLSTDPHFLEIIEHSRATHKREGGILADEMRKRLGL